MATEREFLQAAEYSYPYHHLPHVASNGRLHLGRATRSAMEYLAYTGMVLGLIRDLQPSSLLDVGCGDGRALSELQDEVARIVGVDLDQRAIAFAEAFAPRAQLLLGSVEDIPEVFDVVMCIETLEHVPDQSVPEFVAATAARVRVGGHLVVTVPTTALPVHAKHFRHYDVDTLGETLRDLPGEWLIHRLEEIVPKKPGIDIILRAISNRWWTFDMPLLNEFVLGRLRRPVAAEQRGLHLLAVLQRSA